MSYSVILEAEFLTRFTFVKCVQCHWFAPEILVINTQQYIPVFLGAFVLAHYPI